MSLSKNVKESLKEAEGNIRNAIFWASKNEKTFVCKHLADILHALDTLEKTENMLDKLENRKFGDSGSFGSFFSGS
jgi:dihydroxyacetone kinase-like predicted kinase